MIKVLDQLIKNDYCLYNGDSAEVLKGIPDENIHYSIFSPPFASLYTYSNSDRDLGNSSTRTEFYEHFRYIVAEIYRTLITGRLVSVHCMDIPAMKERDGYIGLIDFPAQIIAIFEQAGFIYHSKVVIWKDPLVEATRTKSLGLMHKQVVKDSSMCRSGLPDYLVTFRKPGINPEPVSHPEGFTRFIGEDEPDAPIKEPSLTNSQKHKNISMCQKDPVYSHQVWRRYASPVWMDIDQSKTLNRKGSRDEKDERHICPLQLDVIERGIELYTNPGDVVLTPFLGIGSEAYQAIMMGRRAIGIELKRSYYIQAVENCKQAETEKSQISLFDDLETVRRIEVR